MGTRFYLELPGTSDFCHKEILHQLMTYQRVTGFIHFSHVTVGSQNPQPCKHSLQQTARLMNETLVHIVASHCGVWAHLLHSNNRVGFYLQMLGEID